MFGRQRNIMETRLKYHGKKHNILPSKTIDSLFNLEQVWINQNNPLKCFYSMHPVVHLLHNMYLSLSLHNNFHNKTK
jgi:hypothetical protein